MDRFRQELANVLLDELGDLVRILVGNETRRELSKGLRRNDRFGAFALITAPEAVQFERRAYPQTFDGGEAGLAEVAGRADGLFEILFLPGERAEGFALSIRNLGNLVIKPRHRDAGILVVKLREQLRQDGE